jgi:hypothetical protein
MLGRSALVALLIGSNLLAGCAAQHARTAGGTIAVLGGATTLVGLGMAAGCEPFPDEEETTCQTDTEPDPENGLRVAGVGLFLLGVGVLIYVAGSNDSNWSSSSDSKSKVTPEEPSTATPPLDRFEPTEESELPARDEPTSVPPEPKELSDPASHSGW